MGIMYRTPADTAFEVFIGAVPIGGIAALMTGIIDYQFGDTELARNKILSFIISHTIYLLLIAGLP